MVMATFCRLEIGDTAGWKPVGNCATLWPRLWTALHGGRTRERESLAFTVKLWFDLRTNNRNFSCMD